MDVQNAEGLLVKAFHMKEKISLKFKNDDIQLYHS
jgi:hypothetical protein